MELTMKNREWYAKLGLELEETGPFYLKVKEAKNWYMIYCNYDFVPKEDKKSFYVLKPNLGTKEIFVNEGFAFEVCNASTGGMNTLLFKAMDKDVEDFNKIVEQQESYDFLKVDPKFSNIRIEYIKSK